jgi:hypothetical protein
MGILFVGGFLLPSAKGVGAGDRKVSNVDRHSGGEKGSNVIFLIFFLFGDDWLRMSIGALNRGSRIEVREGPRGEKPASHIESWPSDLV